MLRALERWSVKERFRVPYCSNKDCPSTRMPNADTGPIWQIIKPRVGKDEAVIKFGSTTNAKPLSTRTPSARCGSRLQQGREKSVQSSLNTTEPICQGNGSGSQVDRT
mgnify:CR=1 FL=1